MSIWMLLSAELLPVALPRIRSWSQGRFPSHKFKGLVKVGAGKGVTRVDLKKNMAGGVSGQPENSPGYATGY